MLREVEFFYVAYAMLRHIILAKPRALRWSCPSLNTRCYTVPGLAAAMELPANQNTHDTPERSAQKETLAQTPTSSQPLCSVMMQDSGQLHTETHRLLPSTASGHPCHPSR